MDVDYSLLDDVEPEWASPMSNSELKSIQLPSEQHRLRMKFSTITVSLPSPRLGD
eukprot:m.65127 g.65127  ORF g.65127 m.65127 type:complete len:55 (-) comp14026_c0_seq14:2163-2327(-)